MTKKELNFADSIDSISRDIKSFDKSLAAERTVEKSQASETGQETSSNQHSNARAAEWSPPTATLNTRIPPEVAELFDDLVYALRKRQHRRLTKQALAIEALTDLLKKHGLLPESESCS